MRISEEGMVYLRSLSDSGELTVARVLADAEDEGHPLHRHFTWDCSEAAEKHRALEFNDAMEDAAHQEANRLRAIRRLR